MSLKLNDIRFFCYFKQLIIFFLKSFNNFIFHFSLKVYFPATGNKFIYLLHSFTGLNVGVQSAQGSDRRACGGDRGTVPWRIPG